MAKKSDHVKNADPREPAPRPKPAKKPKQTSKKKQAAKTAGEQVAAVSPAAKVTQDRKKAPGTSQRARKKPETGAPVPNTATGKTQEILGSKPGKRPYLRTLSDIRRHFYRNQEPYYFISATNFNLMGLDEWVRNFRFINYLDCFDGAHPNVFSPPELAHEPFKSIEDINNYLLQHKQVIDYIKGRGGGGNALFLFFDEQTEELCRELGLRLCFPPAELRSRVDNKVNTVKIGNRAGVPSVPNILSKVTSYEHLREASKGLGKDLVIQTAYGDSGHTTFFISTEKDWHKHAEEIMAEPEVKIMKRIRCRGTAIEGCVTRHGTLAGPLMTELVGFPDLTPYKGGWCGNEVVADVFADGVAQKAREYLVNFGNELWKEGYRGYFEIDILTDEDTGDVYLGELNPRITGVSSMTNLAAFAHADAPLFLFHLLEFADVDFDLDVDELNSRWADPANIDVWSQMVLKHTADTVEYISMAPRSGIYQVARDGSLRFLRTQTHRRTVESENEAFFLRIARPGDYFYEGADLGILVTPGRLMTPANKLTKRAKTWISGIQSLYNARPLQPSEQQASEAMLEVGSFKML